MKRWLEIGFYVIDSIRNEFGVQKINGIINIGL
jgi:hypothetical protein